MTTNESAYWHNVKSKASANLAAVAEDYEPNTEKEIKELLADVLKHGTCRDVAEAIVESIEFMCACHALKSVEPAV